MNNLEITASQSDFQRVLEKNPELLEDQIKPIVAVYILCYANGNGLKIDKESLAKGFYLKYSTIRLREEKMKFAIASV